jgi:hypothetical protein
MQQPPTPPPKRCDRCGEPHPRCKGHRNDGKPCGLWPRRGATVCRRHGGSAPQVKKAAERRQAVVKAQVTAASWVKGPVQNPLEEFPKLVGRVLGFTEFLETQVELLDEKITISGFDKFDTEYEQVKAVVDLYTRLLSESRRVLADYARLQIDDRLAAITQAQADLVKRVIEGLLDDLELSQEQRARAEAELPQRFRALGAA